MAGSTGSLIQPSPARLARHPAMRFQATPCFLNQASAFAQPSSAAALR